MDKLDIQSEINKLKQTIEENQAMLAQMELELTLFNQEPVRDRYGAIVAYVNCHI